MSERRVKLASVYQQYLRERSNSQADDDRPTNYPPDAISYGPSDRPTVAGAECSAHKQAEHTHRTTFQQPDQPDGTAVSTAFAATDFDAVF